MVKNVVTNDILMYKRLLFVGKSTFHPSIKQLYRRGNFFNISQTEILNQRLYQRHYCFFYIYSVTATLVTLNEVTSDLNSRTLKLMTANI